MFRFSRSLVSLSRHSLLHRRPVPRPAFALPSAIPQTHLRRYINTSQNPKRCPACSAVLPTPLPVCPSCAYIAKLPKSMTYYDMLDVPYEPNPFVVDTARLKARFRSAQAIVHPDRWVGKSTDQQATASTMSSIINEALHHLLNPLRRAEYILTLEGLGTEESDKLDDLELLSEIMEAQEELASAESPEQVAEVRKENDVKLQDTIQEIEHLVAVKDWPAVRAAAVKLKYLQGVDSAAEAWPNRSNDH
ncbi:Iron-sulfur cluster co-chaperone protein HscB, mitochondrial [Grifola frondosa]|uniref:Iron-sulfur cluster co-chaperone protein HscB, mitochondrial n=1 Tax=Grifola frondosa TaxID=5627 RepID=A0A1C7MT56_GRIFR|nr:Iron-sulfur cluster co-chaperone protein HscB, mitochondrial [Grifola frondosa]